MVWGVSHTVNSDSHWGCSARRGAVPWCPKTRALGAHPLEALGLPWLGSTGFLADDRGIRDSGRFISLPATDVLNFTFSGKEGQTIISLPESCLFTHGHSDKKLLRGDIAKYDWPPAHLRRRALQVYITASMSAKTQSLRTQSLLMAGICQK